MMTNKHLDQSEATKVLSSLRKLAEIGVRQPPLSKDNEFRARWIHSALNDFRLVGYAARDYYNKEYANLPGRIKNNVDGKGAIA